jgi:hypothetical protein
MISNLKTYKIIIRFLINNLPTQGKNMNYKNIVLMIIFINLILAGWIIIFSSSSVNAQTITEFGAHGEGDIERLITFSGNSSTLVDASTFIEFPVHKGSVRSACMKLTAYGNGDEYPLKPELDVGLDGDADWQFNGTGYGPLGRQQVFNNDESMVNVYTESGPNQNYGILLPMNASVTDSEMELVGGAEKPLTGRNPASGSVNSNLYANYTHHEKLITYLKTYLYCNGGATVIVNGWDPVNLVWEQIYYYYGWSYPRTFIHNPTTPKYTKWEITFNRAYSWYNIYYSFDYNVLMGCKNLTMDIGDDGGLKEYDFDGEFNTSDTIDMTSKLNQLMSATSIPSGADNYGVEYVHIPLIFETEGPGAVQLKNLSITYEFTMNVEVKPNFENMTTELNELIPNEGEGIYRIYLGLSSKSPGKIKIWDLKIVYNAAPVSTPIDDCEIEEDSANLKIKDLSTYFTDDYDDPTKLIYKIEHATNSKHVQINTYLHYLSINATKIPQSNWNGECEIIVSATDNEGVRTLSNMFTLTVNPVDDPPTSSMYLPNLTIIEYRDNSQINLDDPEMGYFNDIDSTELYFQAGILDPDHATFLNVTVNEDNRLVITSLGKWAVDIPVRVYCDDDPIPEDANLSLIDVYQDLMVDVVSANGLYTPQWLEIPDVNIHEDMILEDYVTLTEMVTDYDDVITNITFSIISHTNSGFIDVRLDSTNNIDIYPQADFDKSSIVTLKAEDKDGLYTYTTFTITMIPRNDDPTISLISPKDQAEVEGTITINGTAYDIEDNLTRIELKFGKKSDEWVTAEGLTYWQYVWDTTGLVPDGEDKVKVSVRAFDGENYSAEISIQVIVDNRRQDTDGDGYPDDDDEYPDDPSEWKDTDGDTVGDNADMFPKNRKEWYDSDGDGVGDNGDAFPNDSSQWEDEDGDGYGDNPFGNNADLDPDDPNVNVEEVEEKDEGVDPQLIEYLWLVFAIIIILNILVLIVFLRSRGNIKRK